MGTLSTAQKNTLESKLQRLGEGVNTKLVDDVFDEILNQIGSLKSVSCTLYDGSSLLLQSHDEHVAEVRLPLAKMILRLMCARLAVRAAEWAKREVSPYGDSVEFQVPSLNVWCKVDFENTPEVQRFEIRGKPETCRN